LSQTNLYRKPLLKTITSADFIKNDKRTLEQLCIETVNCRVSYEDVSEAIEGKAYEMCENGNVDNAINHLKPVAEFFESLENKNDEQCRDLADIYLLIGQMLQFALKYEESIHWFSHSIIVDDQYAVPYHNLAISYEKTGKVDSAIRCLKQELLLAPGNYYSYLILSEIYKRQKNFTAYEDCLHQLLLRDPENIQGLFKLIKFYEKNETNADVSLLYKKVLAVTKTFSSTEWLIRIYVLSGMKQYSGALDTIQQWKISDPSTTMVCLAKVYIYGCMKKVALRNRAVEEFVQRNSGKIDKIVKKCDEFGSVFGSGIKGRIEKNIIKRALELYSKLAEL